MTISETLNINDGLYIGFDESKQGFKIGISSNIRKREKQIQHMNPTFKMLFAFRFSGIPHRRVESYFHKEFEEKKIVGEWFDLSASDIAKILRTDEDEILRIFEEYFVK